MKKRVNLSQEIAEQIRQEIIKGQLKPGDRLPGEHEYSKRYQVSRFTIREAMGQLSSIGLVDVRHGVGMFVNTITPESYMKPLASVLALSNKDVVTICEARLPIETQAIRLCAQRATPEDIQALRKTYSEMELCLANDDFEAYNSLDLEFHLEIAKFSGNQIIYEVLNSIQDLLRVQMNDMIVTPNSKERSIKKHLMMIDAIEQGDSDIASLIMTRHINDSVAYVHSREEADNTN